jgi:hypothetical protein
VVSWRKFFDDCPAAFRFSILEQARFIARAFGWESVMECFWSVAGFSADELRTAMAAKPTNQVFTRTSINLPLAHGLRNAQTL